MKLYGGFKLLIMMGLSFLLMLIQELQITTSLPLKNFILLEMAPMDVLCILNMTLKELKNLQKIIQQLRAWELEKPLTLQSYIQWLDQAWITDREEEESLMHDYGRDMVQILTVHRSKGLEFPLVFLLNTAVSARLNEPFIADRSKGEYYIKMSAQVTAAGYQAALEKEKERLKAERIRLLYVAATRARDCLVIPRYHNRSGAGYWADLDPGEFFGRVPELARLHAHAIHHRKVEATKLSFVVRLLHVVK